MSTSFGRRCTSRNAFRSQRVRSQYDRYLQLDFFVQTLRAYNELKKIFIVSCDLFKNNILAKFSKIELSVYIEIKILFSFSITYINVIKNVDQVTPSQIRRWQWGNVHLLVQPFLPLTRSNFSPGDTSQLPSLAGEHLTPTQILYRFGERCFRRFHRHLFNSSFQNFHTFFWRISLKLLRKLIVSRSLGVLIDMYLTAIADSRGNTDCLPGHVSTPVQTHPAEHGTARYARDTHALFDLLSCGLLFISESI